MFRLLFARRSDWAAFTAACILSLSLMLLGRGEQARAAWFIQHTILAPASIVMGWLDRGISVYWQNEKLRKRLAQVEIEADRMRAEHLENTRLRRLLELSQENPSDLAAARVVARSLDRLGGSLTIDKGSNEGVLPDRAVITPDGLVGRVERVIGHEARVLTLLHRDCAVAVRVGRNQVDGVLEWEFGDRPVLNLLYVSSQEDVKRGDTVMTSGLGGIFPEGIRVGEVTKVGVAENGLMKEVQVRPAVNFRNLGEVLVYLPADASRGPRMPALAPPDTAIAGPVAEGAPGARVPGPTGVPSGVRGTPSGGAGKPPASATEGAPTPKSTAPATGAAAPSPGTDSASVRSPQ